MKNFFNGFLEDWLWLRKNLFVEDRLTKIIQTETQKRKRKVGKKTEHSIQELWKKYHTYNWCPKRRRERNWDRRNI